MLQKECIASLFSSCLLVFIADILSLFSLY